MWRLLTRFRSPLRARATWPSAASLAIGESVGSRFSSISAAPSRVEIGLKLPLPALSRYVDTAASLKTRSELEHAVEVLRQRVEPSDDKPFVFLSGPSGAGKTQNEVLFALHNRALMFVSMSSHKTGRAHDHDQTVITDMVSWSSLLDAFAQKDIEALKRIESLQRKKDPVKKKFEPRIFETLSAGRLRSYESLLPSFVLGYVSALMTRFPNGFPINSRTKKLEVHEKAERESFEADILPMTIEEFRAEHSYSSAAKEWPWAVVIDESATLRLWSYESLQPSSRYLLQSKPELFVRNILRAAGIIPILSGTSTSLADVVDSVQGAQRLQPFAYIVAQKTGVPPEVVELWSAQLQAALPSTSSSRHGKDWTALVEFFRGACAKGNSRLATRALDIMKKVCSNAAKNRNLLQPVDLLNAIVSDEAFWGMRDFKFRQHPPSSLFEQLAMMRRRPPQGEWTGSRFVHAPAHFALLAPRCSGLLNAFTDADCSVAVFDPELSDKSVQGRKFDKVVASRFPLPSEDPLMYLMALRNAPGAEALRLRAFDKDDFTARSAVQRIRVEARDAPDPSRPVRKISFDSDALKAVAAIASTLATRVGTMAGATRLAFFKSLCVELMLDEHRPIEFFDMLRSSSSSAHAHSGSSSGSQPSSSVHVPARSQSQSQSQSHSPPWPASAHAARAALSDAELEALLVAHGFPERFPVVAAPSSLQARSWPAAMYGIPGVFLGDYVYDYQLQVGTNPTCAMASKNTERDAGEADHAHGESQAAAWGSWDGALFGPQQPGADRLQRSAEPQAGNVGVNGGGDGSGSGNGRSGEENPRLKDNSSSPIFVVECKNRERHVTKSDLRSMAEKFHSKGPHDCRLLFVVARTFSSTSADLAAEVNKLGMSLLVLRRMRTSTAAAAGDREIRASDKSTAAKDETSAAADELEVDDRAANCKKLAPAGGKFMRPIATPTCTASQPSLSSSTSASLRVESFVRGSGGARSVVLFELGQDLQLLELRY